MSKEGFAKTDSYVLAGDRILRNHLLVGCCLVTGDLLPRVLIVDSLLLVGLVGMSCPFQTIFNLLGVVFVTFLLCS